MCLAMDYIQDHLDEDMSLAAIAESAFFSKYHFHRLFHALVGETVSAHIRRLRLERSASLLRYQPRLNIVTIAHDLGFSSSQNFAKLFRRWSGMSPTQYREASLAGLAREDSRGRKPAAPGSAALGRFWSAPRHDVSMDVVVETMPARHVVYLREMGPYSRQRQGRAIRRLLAWAVARGIETSGGSLGIFLDNPEITSPGQCRYDACLAVPPGTRVDGDVGLRQIPGGTHAMYRCRRKTDRYARDWEDMLSRWLPVSGYLPDDRPNCELVRAGGSGLPAGRLLVDICLPIKPL
jgi:AraC family transcriptional regulator